MDEPDGMLKLQQAIKAGVWPHTMDAQIWARQFLLKFPSGGYDEADLVAWFANAIMAGYDTAATRIGLRP